MDAEGPGKQACEFKLHLYNYIKKNVRVCYPTQKAVNSQSFQYAEVLHIMELAK